MTHNMDQASVDFERGMGDGYNGFPMASETNHDYLDGYTAGEQQWVQDSDQARADEHEQEILDEQARWEAEQQFDHDYWNPVEQSMYDDDPSPYDGNYSEM